MADLGESVDRYTGVRLASLMVGIGCKTGVLLPGWASGDERRVLLK